MANLFYSKNFHNVLTQIKHKALITVSICTICGGFHIQGYTQEIDQVTVKSAPIKAGTLDLVSAIAVIRGPALDQSINSNIGETIAKQVGVDNASYGRAVGRPIIRGVGDYRAVVLENNMSMGDVAVTSPDHPIAASITTSNRVEIIKGPATLRYGPYVTGGVVNVFDPHLSPEADSDIDIGYIRAGYNDVARETNIAAFGQRDIGNANYGVSFYYQDGEDYEIPVHSESAAQLASEGEAAPATITGRAANTAKLEKGTKLSYRRQAGMGDLYTAFSFNDAKFGVPAHQHAHHEEEEHEGEEEEEHHAENSVVNIDMKRYRADIQYNLPLATNGNNILLSGALTQYEHKEFENALAGSTFENESYEMRGEFFHNNPAAWSGVFGLSYKSDDLSVVGQEAFLPSTQSDVMSLFLLESLKRDKWIVEAAFRGDRVSYSRNNYEEGLFNMSLGLGYKTAPTTLIGGSIARTARAPSIIELYADGAHVGAQRFERGNARLDQEKALALEAYYRIERGPARLTLSYYENHFDDFISPHNTGVQDATSQLYIHEYRQSDAKIKGLEVEAYLALPSVQGVDLGVAGNISRQKGTFDAGGNLPTIPPVQTELSLVANMLSLSGELSVRHASKQSDVAANELPTNSWTRLDMSINWQPALEDGPTISLVGRNLTDEEIRYHTSAIKDLLPEPGRDLSLTISQKF